MPGRDVTYWNLWTHAASHKVQGVEKSTGLNSVLAPVPDCLRDLYMLQYDHGVDMECHISPRHQASLHFLSPDLTNMQTYGQWSADISRSLLPTAPYHIPVPFSHPGLTVQFALVRPQRKTQRGWPGEGVGISARITKGQSHASSSVDCGECHLFRRLTCSRSPLAQWRSRQTVTARQTDTGRGWVADLSMVAC